MKVRGTAFLARQATLVRQFGETRTAQFLEEVGGREPFFKSTAVLQLTEIPADAFLRLNEAIVKTFFQGDTQVYWQFGEDSAQWAFTEGPFKALFSSRDFLRFVDSSPLIWKTYFDAGRLEATHAATTAEVKILQVPFPHVYFEYSVLGFFRKGLELTGASRVRQERLRGFSRRDPDVHYRFTWE